MEYAEIILPLPLQGTFSYYIPLEYREQCRIGSRVLVPFGGKKIYTGIVFSLHSRTPENYKPKEIISVLDVTPIIPENLLQIWSVVSQYFIIPLGDLYRQTVPGSLKLQSETYISFLSDAVPENIDLTEQEKLLLSALQVRQSLNLVDIEKFLPRKWIIPSIDQLIGYKLIKIEEKIAEKYSIKEVKYVRLSDVFTQTEQAQRAIQILNKAKKQKEIFLKIYEKQVETPNEFYKKAEILGITGSSNAQLRSLVEKNIIEEFSLEKDRLSSYTGEKQDIPELSLEQMKCVEDILTNWENERIQILQAVPGAGKTHIYLEQLTQKITDEGTGILLVPEISLNKQLVQRLEVLFPGSVAFFHNRLTDFERVEIWRKLIANKIRLLIGTRNSLFLPFKKIDIIIIDESHDTQYKSEASTLAFDGIQTAKMISKLSNVPTLLGSATTRVEDFYSAVNKKDNLILLNESFIKHQPLIIETVDLKNQINQKNLLSETLIIDSTKLEMEKVLGEGNQIMLLHNRRGYASLVECLACGYVAFCSNCDVVMTYHKTTNELKCHYCGQKASKPIRCPKCTSESLSTRGIGIEQVYEELQSIFPSETILRMDADSLKRKNAYEDAYDKIKNKEVKIILGTQMITKGLDFPDIALGIIPRADSLVHFQDFRAEEKAYQLITQFAGRLGRGSAFGTHSAKLIIQTYSPEKYLYQALHKPYEEWFEYLLEDRKKYEYPPYTSIIKIIFKHRKQDKIQRAAQFFANTMILDEGLPAEWVLGPAPAAVSRINLQYMEQILIKIPQGKSHKKVRACILAAQKVLQEVTSYKSISLQIFVNI